MYLDLVVGTGVYTSIIFCMKEILVLKFSVRFKECHFIRRDESGNTATELKNRSKVPVVGPIFDDVFL